MRLLNDIRQLGVKIEAAAGDIKLSFPGSAPPAEIEPLLLSLRKRKVEALAHLQAQWPPESHDCEKRFHRGSPRLYPLIRENVWTLRGTGILVQVGREEAGVVLTLSPDRVTYLDWRDVLPAPETDDA